MNNKKKQIIIAVLGVVGIMVVVTGVTFAFFSYSKAGSKDNTITSGDVKFLYSESSRGITLSEAMPMTDAQGKAQASYFDFTIDAKTPRTIAIPYTVTVRVKDSETTLDADYVKVWLSDQSNRELEENLGVRYFGSTNTELTQNVLARYTGVSYASKYNERVLFTGTVPNDSSSNTYTRDFRLRIWIADNADYSPIETITPSCTVTLAEGVAVNQANCTSAGGEYSETTTTTYPFENKTFKVTVNVYANGQTVAEDLTFRASEVGYSNPSSTLCVNEEDQTIECALDELDTLLQ